MEEKLAEGPLATKILAVSSKGAKRY